MESDQGAILIRGIGRIADMLERIAESQDQIRRDLYDLTHFVEDISQQD